MFSIPQGCEDAVVNVNVMTRCGLFRIVMTLLARRARLQAYFIIGQEETVVIFKVV